VHLIASDDSSTNFSQFDFAGQPWFVIGKQKSKSHIQPLLFGQALACGIVATHVAPPFLRVA
jgi:hypothetical protein